MDASENNAGSSSYNFLWAITGSIRVESKCDFFNETLNLGEKLKNVFDNAPKKSNATNFDFMNLQDLGKSLKLNFPDVKGPWYELPYERSKILNFTDGDEVIKKGLDDRDAKLVSRTGNKENPIFNEWAVAREDGKLEGQGKETTPYGPRECVVAEYDLLLLLGRQRSILFDREMAPMLFNVCMPFGKLIPAVKNGNEQIPDSCFLVVPIISFTAKPKNKAFSFRNALSISLLLVPVNKDFNGKQEVLDSKMHETIAREIPHFELTGCPLKDFLDLTNQEKPISIVDLLNSVSKKITEILTTEILTTEREMKVENQLSKSTYVTHGVLLQSLNPTAIHDIYKNFIQKYVPDDYRDTPFYRELKGILIPHLNNEDKENADVTNLKSMLIADEARLMSGGLIFFNRLGSVLTSLYPTSEEVKLNFTMALYWSISTSLLNAMIHSLHQQLGEAENQKYKKLMDLETEFFKDIDEYYDLDFNWAPFKEKYEKIRKIDGVDRDFQMVKGKLGALKTNIVLGKQVSLDNNIFILTAFSIVIALGAIITEILVGKDMAAPKAVVNHIDHSHYCYCWSFYCLHYRQN